MTWMATARAEETGAGAATEPPAPAAKIRIGSRTATGRRLGIDIYYGQTFGILLPAACRERYLGRPARLADTDDFDMVGGCLEADLSSGPLDPAACATPFELDDTMAAAANHMVVVTLAAQAITGLPGNVSQRIQNPMLR
jgi:hypothetical protein